MSEPITEIPAAIRALPEAEQGPALVKAIHDRKAAEQYNLGVRAGIAAVRGALAAGAGALPSDSPLRPGIDKCLQTVSRIQKEMLNA